MDNRPKRGHILPHMYSFHPSAVKSHEVLPVPAMDRRRPEMPLRERLSFHQPVPILGLA